LGTPRSIDIPNLIRSERQARISGRRSKDGLSPARHSDPVKKRNETPCIDIHSNSLKQLIQRIVLHWSVGACEKKKLTQRVDRSWLKMRSVHQLRLMEHFLQLSKLRARKSRVLLVGHFLDLLLSGSEVYCRCMRSARDQDKDEKRASAQDVAVCHGPSTLVLYQIR
jgi:hypothetical protein